MAELNKLKIEGEHGEPGESGGNVYVICEKIFDAHRWQIKSDGGRGSDGQNGGNGADEEGEDGNRQRWATIEEFRRYFPSMSKSKSIFPFRNSPKPAMKVVLKTLNVDPDRRRYGKEIKPNHKLGDFFIEGPCRLNDAMATVSFYDARKERHSFILVKCESTYPCF